MYNRFSVPSKYEIIFYFLVFVILFTYSLVSVNDKISDIKIDNEISKDINEYIDSLGSKYVVFTGEDLNAIEKDLVDSSSGSVESYLRNKEKQLSIEVDENIAISPLAIPILAGPGTIVTAMNYVSNANYLHIGVVIFIFAIMCYLTYIAFSLSDFIVEKIGNNIITVVGKIMGLIIAIIGVNMLIEGIKLAFIL